MLKNINYACVYDIYYKNFYIMILGSHNSITYKKPKHWWKFFMIPFARCQNKNLQYQYDKGVRCFDIRIRPTKTHEIEFAHGMLDFSKDAIKDLDLIYSKCVSENEKVYIRLILEDTLVKLDDNAAENWFIDFVKMMENQYPFFIIFECRRKSDWKQLVIPKSNYYPKIDQHVSSMSKDVRWYEKIIPYFYAKRTNKNYIPNQDCDIVFFDFIK